MAPRLGPDPALNQVARFSARQKLQSVARTGTPESETTFFGKGQTMGMTRRRCVLAVATTLGLISWGMRAAGPTAGLDELVALVEQRVRQWQPTREERRFDD